jgi:hypothetical protein
MPLLSFTHLLPKLLDQSKLQTIRKPRKIPLRVGDLLYVYWKCRTPEAHKLGEARIRSIVRKPFCEITAEDFRRDGFGSPLPNLKDFVFLPKPKLENLLGAAALWATRTILEAYRAFASMHHELKELGNWGAPFDIITFEWVSGPNPPEAKRNG